MAVITQELGACRIDCNIPRFFLSPRSSLMPQASATSLTKASDLCMLSDQR